MLKRVKEAERYRHERELTQLEKTQREEDLQRRKKEQELFMEFETIEQLEKKYSHRAAWRRLVHRSLPKRWRRRRRLRMLRGRSLHPHRQNPGLGPGVATRSFHEAESIKIPISIPQRQDFRR